MSKLFNTVDGFMILRAPDTAFQIMKADGTVYKMWYTTQQAHYLLTAMYQLQKHCPPLVENFVEALIRNPESFDIVEYKGEIQV